MKKTTYLVRTLEERLKNLFQKFPVIVVSGARQVGKSTLLDHVFGSKAKRVVFDPLTDVQNARADPELFLENQKTPLILDEIQYVPELIPALKRRLENNKSPGQYLITGSQQWQVMKLLAESLAGRAILFDLFAFSIAEIHQNESWLAAWLSGHKRFSAPRDKKTLSERLWRGFMPAAQFLDNEALSYYLDSYVKTYVEKDARLIAEVSDWRQFTRFYRLCAALTGQEINVSQIGRDIGVTPQTAGRWLDVLKATFQWHEIQAFSRNSLKKISKKSKGYFLDTGLACWALGISSPDTLLSHPQWGSVFETAVVNDIIKQTAALKPSPQLYHWRVHSGAEVDLIVEINGKFYPMEIKSKSKIDKNDAKGIQTFIKDYRRLKIETGLILAPVKEMFALTENIFVMPWDSEVK